MTKLIFIALLLVSSQAVSANQGEVCTEKQWTKSVVHLEKGLDNTDVYKCPSLGDVTIPQIYQNGWRIQHIELAIKHENDGLLAYSKRRLLIEKPL